MVHRADHHDTGIQVTAQIWMSEQRKICFCIPFVDENIFYRAWRWSGNRCFSNCCASSNTKPIVLLFVSGKCRSLLFLLRSGMEMIDWRHCSKIATIMSEPNRERIATTVSLSEDPRKHAIGLSGPKLNHLEIEGVSSWRSSWNAIASSSSLSAPVPSSSTLFQDDWTFFDEMELMWVARRSSRWSKFPSASRRDQNKHIPSRFADQTSSKSSLLSLPLDLSSD